MTKQIIGTMRTTTGGGKGRVVSHVYGGTYREKENFDGVVRITAPFTSSGVVARKTEIFNGKELAKHNGHRFHVRRYGVGGVTVSMVFCEICRHALFVRHHHPGIK